MSLSNILLIPGIGGSSVPTNALRDRAGNPILDRDGNFILTREE